SEEGEVHWRGEQGLWGAHREERLPIRQRRYLGDAANEEVYCELRYQGQLYDVETGLYYNRHRYYDAESGQYISPDPIGLLGGIRPQSYVHNPLEWVDPLGLNSNKCPESRDGSNSKKSRSGRPDPLEEAEGRPHTIIERPGPDGQYTTHNGDGTWKQYRGSGQDHGGIPRPNVKETTLNQAPNGKVFVGKSKVRLPRPDEFPGGKE
ncbi:RHS repeat-associated core domain-containing protein, partial [Brenneria nigrifluens]